MYDAKFNASAVKTGKKELGESYAKLLSIEQSEVDSLNQDILQLVSTDTATFVFEDYLLWIKNIGTYASDVWRVQEFIALQNYSKAHEFLDSVDIKRKLGGKEQADLANVRAITDMIERKGLDYFHKYDRDTIRSFATAGLMSSSTWARAILSLSGEDLSPIYTLCSSAPKQEAFLKATIEMDAVARLYVLVAPNPSSGIVNFTILDEAIGASHLEIYDLSGRKVHATEMTGSQYTWDASSTGSGIYVYTLRDHKGKMHSGKIIIQ